MGTGYLVFPPITGFVLIYLLTYIFMLLYQKLGQSDIVVILTINSWVFILHMHISV